MVKVIFCLFKWIAILALSTLASNIVWEWLMERLGLVFPPNVDAIARIFIVVVAFSVFIWSAGGTKVLSKIIIWIRKRFNANDTVAPLTLITIRLVVVVIVVIIGITQYPFLLASAKNRQTANINPYSQTMQTVKATVEVITNSKEEINSYLILEGGYLGFGKGNTALLITSSSDSFANQLGDSRVRYRGEFEMNTLKSIQQPISILKDAEFIEIYFSHLPKNVQVLSGQAAVIVNNNIRFDFTIPPQQAIGSYVYIPDIQKYMPDLK